MAWKRLRWNRTSASASTRSRKWPTWAAMSLSMSTRSSSAGGPSRDSSTITAPTLRPRVTGTTAAPRSPQRRAPAARVKPGCAVTSAIQPSSPLVHASPTRSCPGVTHGSAGSCTKESAPASGAHHAARRSIPSTPGLTVQSSPTCQPVPSPSARSRRGAASSSMRAVDRMCVTSRRVAWRRLSRRSRFSARCTRSMDSTRSSISRRGSARTRNASAPRAGVARAPPRVRAPTWTTNACSSAGSSRSWRHSSSADRPVIPESSSTRSGRTSCASAMASSPLVAARASCPASRIQSRMLSRCAGSSSTTRIRAPSVLERGKSLIKEVPQSMTGCTLRGSHGAASTSHVVPRGDGAGHAGGTDARASRSSCTGVRKARATPVAAPSRRIIGVRGRGRQRSLWPPVRWGRAGSGWRGRRVAPSPAAGTSRGTKKRPAARGDGARMVEAAGIEPASENRSLESTTGLSGRLSLARPRSDRRDQWRTSSIGSRPRPPSESVGPARVCMTLAPSPTGGVRAIVAAS